MLRQEAWRRSKGSSHQIRASVAGSENHLAGRLRILPQRIDELVRKQALWIMCSGWHAISGYERFIGRQMWEATEQWNRTGKPARVFTEFRYQTRRAKNRGWDRERRVVAKAEHIDGKENPRFVVTSLSPERWAAPGAVRRTVLRSRRYGEPDQRAIQFVRRSGERGDDAGQSTASVLFGDGVCAGQRIAAARIESDRVCAGTSINDPYEAAEDRRTGAGDGAQGLDLDGIQLPVAKRVSEGLVEPALLTQHDWRGESPSDPTVGDTGLDKCVLPAR